MDTPILLLLARRVHGAIAGRGLHSALARDRVVSETWYGIRLQTPYRARLMCAEERRDGGACEGKLIALNCPVSVHCLRAGAFAHLLTFNEGLCRVSPFTAATSFKRNRKYAVNIPFVVIYVSLPPWKLFRNRSDRYASSQTAALAVRVVRLCVLRVSRIALGVACLPAPSIGGVQMSLAIH